MIRKALLGAGLALTMACASTGPVDESQAYRNAVIAYDIAIDRAILFYESPAGMDRSQREKDLVYEAFQCGNTARFLVSQGVLGPGEGGREIVRVTSFIRALGDQFFLGHMEDFDCRVQP